MSKELVDEKKYYFVSYNFDDFKKVRVVRNAIEETGKYPILFFLASLDAPENKKELRTLLKREIKARKWFVMCESQNAKKSDTVDFERQYFKKIKNKMHKREIVINLDDYNKDRKGLARLRKETIKKIGVRKPTIVYWNVEKEYEDFFNEALDKESFDVDKTIELEDLKLKKRFNPKCIILCLQIKSINNEISLDEYRNELSNVIKQLKQYNVPIILNILYKAINNEIYFEVKPADSKYIDRTIDNIKNINRTMSNPSNYNRVIPDNIAEFDRAIELYEKWEN